MNEQELRERLAEQASVIHELKRDAAGMSAIIADLRVRIGGRARGNVNDTFWCVNGVLGANSMDPTKPAEIRHGKMRCANGDWRRQTREATVRRCDRHEGEHPWSDDETV